MARGGWLLLVLGLLLALSLLLVAVSLINDARNIWAAALFVLGTLVGITWDRTRKR